MQVPFVDLKAQYSKIKTDIDSSIKEVVAHTAFVGGQYVKSFEQAFAEFCGADHCVSVGNGTDALYLAMKCAGIGNDHEVIVPANSFIATSEAVTQTGAKVVFCDINPDTYTLDVKQLEHLITEKTRAVLPVHLYGHPADMTVILEWAEKHDLIVIEDAAQAHGAMYKERPIGTLGNAGCFSFYPGKNLGAYGDAGAVVTNDSDLAEKIRMFSNHGRVDKYDHLFEGVNSRLDGLQAAILQSKLKYLAEWTAQRRVNASLYNKLLKDVDVITPSETSDVYAVYHLYVIRVADGRRDALKGILADKGISCGIHYPISLPLLKAYAYLDHKSSEFPVATQYSKEILSLPMYPELSKEQIEYVVQNIRLFLNQ